MREALTWLFEPILTLVQLAAAAFLLAVLIHMFRTLARRPSVAEAIYSYCKTIAEGLLAPLERRLAGIRNVPQRRAISWLILFILLIGVNHLACSVINVLPPRQAPPAAAAPGKSQPDLTAEQRNPPGSMRTAPP